LFSFHGFLSLPHIGAHTIPVGILATFHGATFGTAVKVNRFLIVIKNWLSVLVGASPIPAHSHSGLASQNFISRESLCAMTSPTFVTHLKLLSWFAAIFPQGPV
jgi:hypothetical protein